MPVSDIIKAKLLFVDDDQSFLDFLRQTFGEFSHGEWEMHFATHASQALDLLRAQSVDLAMLDLNMPDVDGMQLLRTLNQEFPALPKAFLTGQGDEHSRRAGLEEGAALFLEKPASLAGMESLFATINELARWQQRMGGRGVVRRASLLDLVKMECKSGNSRLFEIFGAGEQGQIWIKQGAITHALAPDKRGQSAFTHLVCLRDAEFHLKPFVEPVERSIDREWEFLVLEAGRVQEQLLKTPDAPAVAPPPAKAPVAAPRVEPEKIIPIKLPARPVVPPAPPVPPPTPIIPVVPVEPVFPPVAAAPATRLLAAEPDAAGLHIEELLVCSDRREVFYEWQCAETQKRLGLIDFVAHKSRQLGQCLPLGKMDRLELQAINGRIVIQFHGNRNVLLRSNTKTRPPGPGTTPVAKSIPEWVAQQTPTRGLLAFGVTLADRKTLHQCFAPDFSMTALAAAWPCVADTFDAAARAPFAAWQLRWIYERAQLYCVRRSDGASLGLVLAKDAVAGDLAAVERLFEEFKSLRGA